jgi:hypothetical protein
MPRLSLIAAALLLASSVHAQALLSYPGRTPGQATAAAAGTPAASRPRSAGIFGDSIMADFCSARPLIETLALELPGYSFSNLAQAGTTTSQINDRYFDKWDDGCAGEPCGAYLFQGGVNNCHSATCDPETMLADMLEAVDDARALPGDPVVAWTNIAPFLGCTPCAGPEAPGWVLAQQYNALWAAACAARPDITCIDVGAGTPWEGDAGYLAAAWSCDGIHWLQAASNAWAALAAQAF